MKLINYVVCSSRGTRHSVNSYHRYQHRTNPSNEPIKLLSLQNNTNPAKCGSRSMRPAVVFILISTDPNNSRGLIQPNAVPPSIRTRIDHNLIREGIRFTGRNRRDMIFIPVHNRQNLQRRLLQHIAHGLADLCSLCTPSISIILASATIGL